MRLKRYEPWADDDYMYEISDGKWVEYDDVVDLIESLSGYRRLVESLVSDDPNRVNAAKKWWREIGRR